MNLSFIGLTLLSGLALAHSAIARVDQILPVLGGADGGRFYARCAGGDILNGLVALG